MTYRTPTTRPGWWGSFLAAALIGLGAGTSPPPAPPSITASQNKTGGEVSEGVTGTAGRSSQFLRRVGCDVAVGEGIGAATSAVGMSFRADTRVAMADKTTKPISAITITTKDRTGHPISSVLHTTAAHPIWDNTSHTWTKAIDLPTGHQLLTPNGHLATTHHGRAPPTPAGVMWDLTIADTHTFYVQTTPTTNTHEAVLVHNCGSVDNASKAVKMRESMSFELQPTRFMSVNRGTYRGA